MPTPERYLIEKSLHIVDKERRVVPFALNPTQVLFDSNFTGHDIVAKARQKGVTSLYLGRHLMSCISQDHQVCALISHESQATMRHLGRVHWMLEKLRETASVEVGRASQYEITFPRTHSHYYIGTAGSKNFGRGETISKLHMTEVAFWENASEIALGLMQAVPASGEIGIESTGNGQGNWFHRQVMAANNGDGAYRLHFFPWNIDDEYRKLLSPGQTASLLTNLNEEWDEPRLIREFSLTAEQLAWRRDKIVNECDYDLDKFKQEYPLTLDECFRASGGSVFQKINFVRTPEWQRSTDDRRLQLLSGHPHPAQTYCIGADASGGVMKDSSVAIVFNRTTGEQVGEWASNSTPPDSFGRDVLPTLGMLFNGALIVVESNNHGIAVLDNLRNNYQSGLIYESPVGEKKQEGMLLRLGFRTTQKTKPLVIGRIRRCHARGSVVIHSPSLADEMRSFVEDSETGKLGASEGCFDDRVMAHAMALQAMPHLWNDSEPLEIVDQPRRPPTAEEIEAAPFTLEAIMERIHAKHEIGYGLPSSRARHFLM